MSEKIIALFRKIYFNGFTIYITTWSGITLNATVHDWRVCVLTLPCYVLAARASSHLAARIEMNWRRNRGL